MVENLKQEAQSRRKSEECDMYTYRQSLSEKNLQRLRNLFIFYVRWRGVSLERFHADESVSEQDIVVNGNKYVTHIFQCIIDCKYFAGIPRMTASGDRAIRDIASHYKGKQCVTNNADSSCDNCTCVHNGIISIMSDNDCERYTYFTSRIIFIKFLIFIILEFFLFFIFILFFLFYFINFFSKAHIFYMSLV